MSNYQVTARKWRPQDFSQLVGQEHVTTALTNAINSGKIPHAYLFSGPRGVGKTSSARILAKMLTCVESPNICGKCTACQEISTGQSLDVREIDGASNRGIEQIREIRDNAIYAPLSLKYKIFIIDEVHMLTKEASNALLKVLEEPPEHVIFMLATTEANKILPTIRSRCQHYLLKRIPLDTLIDRLSLILDNEGHTYDREALEEIAYAGDGSMRDSQTILDQVVLYSQGHLTVKSTREVLGIPESSYFETITKAIADQNIVLMLEQINTYLMEAGDGMSFAENFTKFLRKALLVKKLPANHPLLELSQDKYDLFKDITTSLSEDDVLTLLNISLELCETLRQEKSERFWIESALFKMLDYKNRISISELRQEIFKALGRESSQPISPRPQSVPQPTRPAQPTQQTISRPQQTSQQPTQPKSGGVFTALLQEQQAAQTQRPPIERPSIQTRSVEHQAIERSAVQPAHQPTPQPIERPPVQSVPPQAVERPIEPQVAPTINKPIIQEQPPINTQPNIQETISDTTTNNRIEDDIANLFDLQ